MSKRYGYQRLACLILSGSLLGFSGSLQAAGFQLMEQSGNLSTAYAGTASLAEDASTNFYNAAGLARTVLPCQQLVGSAVVIVPRAKLTASQATTTIGTPFNLGSGVAKNHPVSLVPALHYLYRFDDCWAFGVSVVSPFGLKVKYKDDSVVRYLNTRSEIRTYDVCPSLAYNFGHGFSLGAGADIVYVWTKIENQLGLGVVATDGTLDLTADDFAYGGHVGALYEFSDCARIGVNYRSKLKVHAKGEAILNAITTLAETRDGISSRVTLPDTVVISAYGDLTDCWAVMADVQFTRWSTFKQLKVDFDSGTTVTTTFRFKNATRYSLGTSYQIDDCWRTRFGVAYDQSPVRKEFRTVSIPDSDRIWLGMGVQYRFDKCLAMELSYAHLFFKKASINQGPPIVTGGPAQNQSLQGRYRAHADLVGVQFTWDIA